MTGLPSMLDPMRPHPRRAPEAVAHGTGGAVTLRFGGRKYKSIDWSLGGCRIQGASDQFQVQQRIAGRIRVAGADGRGEFVAEIEHLDADGSVALRWLEMSPHIFVAMHGLAQ